MIALVERTERLGDPLPVGAERGRVELAEDQIRGNGQAGPGLDGRQVGVRSPGESASWRPLPDAVRSASAAGQPNGPVHPTGRGHVDGFPASSGSDLRRRARRPVSSSSLALPRQAKMRNGSASKASASR